MTTSESINELAAALSKAQGEMAGAAKSSANPFFKSKYADLASVRDVIQGPFAKHGLAVVQSPTTDGSRVSVETLLLHTSGQWIRDALSCTAKDESPQAVGSCITYLRRYALQAFAGVAAEDDDGEAAQNHGTQSTRLVPSVPKGYDEWLETFRAEAGKGMIAMRAAWTAAPQTIRDYTIGPNRDVHEALKKTALEADTAAANAKAHRAS